MTLHLPHSTDYKSLPWLCSGDHFFPSWTFSLLPEHSPNRSLKKLSHAKTKPKSCPSQLGRAAWNQNTTVTSTSWPVCLWERQSVSHWLDRIRFFWFTSALASKCNVSGARENLTDGSYRRQQNSKDSYHGCYFCTTSVPRKCSHLEQLTLTPYSPHILRMIYKNKVLSQLFLSVHKPWTVLNLPNCLLTCKMTKTTEFYFSQLQIKAWSAPLLKFNLSNTYFESQIHILNH